MLRGIYNSALGMNVQMQRMDVVANNLANADTIGFKRDSVITQSFQDVLGMRIRENDLGIDNRPVAGTFSLGTFVHTIFTDFSAGSLRQTGASLDLALDSLGFFEIASPDAGGGITPRYTRDGSFAINQEGALITMDGFMVLSTEGAPIILQNGHIEVFTDGRIFSNGELAGQIRIVNFEDPQTLRAFGHNLFSTTPESVEIPFAGRVMQGYLENSNTNSVREMVDMISLSRAFEANQRALSMRDQILGQAVSEIARR
ncbi:MAG: flagellar hook-basal body protein [Defluviitaleaceae bacterium]|nr:flagellar hook-basal body protein [Defluviitaleaceae bacterium]